MSNAQEPRSKIEVIYREVLGEVGNLVGMLERVTATVNQCMDDARSLPMDTRQAVAETNRRLNDETMREFGRLSDRLDRLMLAAEENARTIQAGTRRLSILACAVGAAAGGLAAVLVVAVVATRPFGA
ncbi:hypothetical protein [Castellaniella sp. UC4442_H9]